MTSLKINLTHLTNSKINSKIIIKGLNQHKFIWLSELTLILDQPLNLNPRELIDTIMKFCLRKLMQSFKNFSVEKNNVENKKYLNLNLRRLGN